MSLGCRSCEGIEGDGNLSSPGCAGSMSDPQPISDRPVGLGFPHRAGRFRPREITVFVPRLSELYMYGGIYDPGMGPCRRQRHYSRAPANQRSAGGVGVSTPCGAVSTRGITVFVPGLSYLYIYGGISDPGMGPCRPRVALTFSSSPSRSAIGRRGWGFHTVRGGSDPGITIFVPALSEL